jgi:hypothetical protein
MQQPISKNDDQNDASIESALLVNIRLSDDHLGTEDDRDEISSLTDALEGLLQANNLGEVDGDEFGKGYGIIYIYGTDVDKMFDFIAPIVKQRIPSKRIFLIKRYGELDNREEKIEL